MGAARSIPPAEGNVIPEVDYASIKVGLKKLEDAVFSLGDYKTLNPKYGDKKAILEALKRGDIDFMRDASNFYFNVSGIYARLCKHLANLYRYDWYLTSHNLSDKIVPNKELEGFYQNLAYLDAFRAKSFLGDAALKIFLNGCYYGYLVHGTTTAQVQELDPKYCRSRYTICGKPAIEFNMRYFDDKFPDPSYRIRVLGLFPKEFKKGYVAYKEGKLTPDYPGDKAGWYLLDPECTFKFNVNGSDCPPFFSVIPHLIDLDAAQELDRKKMAQKLLKIIIQKMPLDKNGELIFDVDEAQELHNNAVRMLGKAIGIDVLTTFADVEVADMADRNAAASIDELEKVERTVYNESGTAQNLFNTDGNIALEKSILDDEANVYGLLLQFEAFLNSIIKPLSKNPKKLYYRVEMLPTTVYNYKEMSKLYKEQSNVGGSKLLANIALGQSQSAVIAAAKFENQVLDISTLFSSKQQLEEREMKKSAQNNQSAQPANAPKQKEEKKPVGRQEKPDDQKSEKTIRNKEAMS